MSFYILNFVSVVKQAGVETVAIDCITAPRRTAIPCHQCGDHMVPGGWVPGGAKIPAGRACKGENWAGAFPVVSKGRNR